MDLLTSWANPIFFPLSILFHFRSSRVRSFASIAWAHFPSISIFVFSSCSEYRANCWAWSEKHFQTRSSSNPRSAPNYRRTIFLSLCAMKSRDDHNTFFLIGFTRNRGHNGKSSIYHVPLNILGDFVHKRALSNINLLLAHHQPTTKSPSFSLFWLEQVEKNTVQ